MPFLLDMPDLAMSKILDHLEFRSILSFQKVSRNVYDYIGDKKPDLKLKKIEIDVEPSRVTEILKCHSQKKPLRIRYQDHVFGCQVSFENRVTVIEDVPFLNVFYRDILQYAQHQKSTLKEFSLKAQRVPEEIKRVLLFKARKVTVSTSCQKDILDILQCFGGLSSISVYNMGENAKWTLDDRWMTSGHSLIVRGFQFDIPVTRICHYDNVDIWMTEISARDLWALKEEFFKNPGFEECRLKFDIFHDMDLMPGLFGPSFFKNSFLQPDIRCFFQIPQSNRLLSIVYCDTSVQFSVIYMKNE